MNTKQWPKAFVGLCKGSCKDPGKGSCKNLGCIHSITLIHRAYKKRKPGIEMNSTMSVKLDQQHHYQFTNHFGEGIASLVSDEPAPLGASQGPSPVQLLCSAVGNCLCASLLFACGKFKSDPGLLHCEVQATTGRNEQARIRILGLQVNIHLGRASKGIEHIDRILSQFEEFCTVTQSVRSGIKVTLNVFDSDSTLVHESG